MTAKLQQTPTGPTSNMVHTCQLAIARTRHGAAGLRFPIYTDKSRRLVSAEAARNLLSAVRTYTDTIQRNGPLPAETFNDLHAAREAINAALHSGAKPL